MPDIAGDNTTTSSISVGSSLSSSIETPNDHDWVRIYLIAGQSITITLSGSGANPLSDPYLRLRDASGNLLTENDDSGGSLNSSLSYTATSTGTYYIDAAAWVSDTGETSTGDYTLQVRPYTPPPIGSVSDIAYQLTNGYWGGSSHHFNVTQGGNLTVNLTALTADGINLARLALGQWSSVIGVSFVEVASGGQITFDDNQQGAFSSANYSNGITTSAVVNVSTQWLADYGTTLNTYGYQTYLHEIGHALGLGHAGDYNTTATYLSDAMFRNDAWPLSVMSYFSVNENPYFADQGYTRSYVGTPMVADIAAVSVLYGLSTTTRLGATTYGYNSNAGNVYNAALYPTIAYTVFDSGGIDTLDYSGFAQNQTIDLHEAAFSNVGGRTGNVSIALGTVIENAIGGFGSDHIFGNDVANLLTGGSGNDFIYGGGGDDIISADRLLGFDNVADIDTLFGEGGNDSIFAGYGDIVDGGDGFDVVYISYIGGNAGINGDTATLFAGQPLVAGGGTLSNIESFATMALTRFSDTMVVGDQSGQTTVYAWEGDDTITGQNRSVTFHGGDGNDLLVGSINDDVLNGDNGDDRLIGGYGDDVLTGGEGRDRFIFGNLDLHDRILDFRTGTDQIDLTAIDANAHTAGDQAFTFIGDANFSGVAGELRGYWDANNTYFIAGDVNGDGIADLVVEVGGTLSGSQLNSADFLF